VCTRPPRRRRRAGDGQATGYGRVLADRRFLAFCAISLLPLFIFGQMYASLPVLVTGTLHVQQSTWALLMSFMAVVVVLVVVLGLGGFLYHKFAQQQAAAVFCLTDTASESPSGNSSALRRLGCSYIHWRSLLHLD